MHNAVYVYTMIYLFLCSKIPLDPPLEKVEVMVLPFFKRELEGIFY